MTPKQKAELRASEIRKRLAELGGIEEQTDESRSEIDKLRTEYQDVETRVQALAVAADEPESTEVRTEDTEAKELRALERKASIGAIFDATLEHRQTDGETAELQQHLHLGANQIPLVLLIEQRAVTPAPGDVGASQDTIIPGVFPDSCAAFLGVDMPTVGVGEKVYPVLTQNAIAGTPAEGAVPTGTGLGSLGETTGTFSAEVLSPSRIQAAFFYSREDRARFMGMDEALRDNLSAALMDKLDQEILVGTNGLLTGTNLANHAASAETTFANYVASFGYGRVDGRYASSTSMLRAVMGSATLAHAGTTYRHANADDLAIERLMAITGGIKVSAHVPAVASNKQNAVIRLGMRRDMVAPIWEGVTLIPDEITKASSGEIVVTAVMLHAVKILRSAGFYKQETQHA